MNTAKYFRDCLKEGRNAEDLLYKVLDQLETEERVKRYEMASRFYRKVAAFEHNGISYPERWIQVRPDVVSSAFDMADCDWGDNEPERYFFLDEDHQFYPVSAGNLSRFANWGEENLYYGSAPLIANGKEVGEVLYSDH